MSRFSPLALLIQQNLILGVSSFPLQEEDCSRAMRLQNLVVFLLVGPLFQKGVCSITEESLGLPFFSVEPDHG